MDYSSLTLILPTLNEEENISQLLDFIISSCPGIHMLVVDDSSKDSTRDKALSKGYPNLKLIVRKENPGLTASIIEGIKAAETPFFIVMDSDFQHPPEKIPELYSLLLGGADLAVACRGEVKDWLLHRKAISKGADFLANLRLSFGGCPKVSDVMSGYFGARRDWALKSIASNPKRFAQQGYKFLFDLLKGMKKKDVNAGEITYVFNGRLRGKSKIGLPHIFRFLRSIFS